jgi:hypothetical protein
VFVELGDVLCIKLSRPVIQPHSQAGEFIIIQKMMYFEKEVFRKNSVFSTLKF